MSRTKKNSNRIIHHNDAAGQNVFKTDAAINKHSNTGK
jgi:hypothetical protein